VSQGLHIVGADVVLPDGTIESGAIAVSDGVIAAVGEKTDVTAPGDAREIDAHGLLVAPGLIELQINGGFGHDFTKDASSIWEVGARLPAFGVTSFLPTVVTSAAPARESMLAAMAGGAPAGYRGSIPLGAHFEGPFISPDASGAHDTSFLRTPVDSDPDVAGWSAAAGVRIVTLAPELDGALALVRELVARGVVVSAGHTTADHDQAVAAFDAGITYTTHLFNAMAPLGHREPGLVGAALGDDRVTVGVIADGIHVHPTVVKLVSSAVGRNRLSLVTDATAALGMPPGRYMLGGRDVVLDGSSVRLADDGRLAGSALTEDEELRRFVAMTDRTSADAIAALTSVPAQLLRLEDRGAIRVGARADLVLLTRELEVVATFVGGDEVHVRWA
jgi:N-acetylglucosamine-6-phosphate deacetylase